MFFFFHIEQIREKSNQLVTIKPIFDVVVVILTSFFVYLSTIFVKWNINKQIERI